MFTLQVDTLDPVIMSAFANMFTELAKKGASNRTEMTGKQYIEKLDTPDIGADIITPKLQPTTTAAAVFGASPLPPTIDPATDNIAPPPPDPATVFGAPVTHRDISRTVHADGTVSTVSVGLPPDIDPAEVFAYEDPNALAASLPTASGAANVSDPAQNTNPAPVQNGVILDSKGLPWDARIHAGSRTQNKDATWKKKKGVDDATIVAVEAELRAVLAIPVKPFTPLNAPAHDATQAPPPLATASASAPPPPPPAAPAAPAASGTPTTFAELCKYITGRALKAERILEVCNRHGFAGLGLVAVRPDAIPALYADFASA